MLADAPRGCLPALVDSPGFEESGKFKDRIKAVADKSLEGGNAYMIVIPYTQMQDAQDTAMLTRLEQLDPG